jgi:sirohydrochlorin cobaltochelatase
VEDLVAKGATNITVMTTMFTPGGAHAEIEIPETLDRLRRSQPSVVFHYAWPYDLELVASLLKAQLEASGGSFASRFPFP